MEVGGIGWQSKEEFKEQILSHVYTNSDRRLFKKKKKKKFVQSYLLFDVLSIKLYFEYKLFWQYDNNTLTLVVVLFYKQRKPWNIYIFF